MGAPAKEKHLNVDAVAANQPDGISRDLGANVHGDKLNTGLLPLSRRNWALRLAVIGSSQEWRETLRGGPPYSISSPVCALTITVMYW